MNKQVVKAYFKQYIKKNPYLYYWALCFYRRKDSRFRQYFLDYRENPRVINFHKLGEKNPDTNIYWIKVGNSSVGMFSLCIWTLRYLEFAHRFHLIPVVSWIKEVPYYKEGGVNGADDPFEYYFQQPTGLTIFDAIQSSDVAISRQQDQAYGNIADSYDFSDNEIGRLSKIWAEYMRLQPSLEKEIAKHINELFNNKKVIGVHVRGADWRKMKISGHPVTATEEEYIKAVKNAIEETHYEKVFLATDSDATLEKFHEAFGEKLLYYPDVKRTPKDGESLVIFDKKNDPYQMGVEIILDAMTLAACDGFIAGVSYVSYAVRIIKASREQTFETLKIIDKGLQKKSDMDFKKAAELQRKALKSN